MTKPIIGIDWNSTLANNIGLICQCTGLHSSQFNEWNPDLWTPALGQRMKMGRDQFNEWMWAEPMLQAMAEPYPGAASAVGRLSSWAEVWIVTSTACPQLVAPWLRKWGIQVSRAIVTSDKASVPWDLLIDDNPFTLESLQASGRRVLRHRLPWNEHLVEVEGMKW